MRSGVGRRLLGARGLVGGLALLSALVLSAAAALAHETDHPAPRLDVGAAPPGFAAGGRRASWELIETIATGNPHTDLDFFTSGGSTYASVGTLGIGPNAGGQTIVRLTQGRKVAPKLISSHPSAGCLSDPTQATGLQHDVEATPKGKVLLNSPNPFAVRSPAQLLIDATDAPGRCHDQGLLGLEAAPQGGLEIVDITDPASPVEIGLVSHIGEAHTVNVDPKRPHIAYAVSSDAISVSEDANDIDEDGNTRELIRENEDPAASERFDLDGFEVVDLSSCLNFPPGAKLERKRAACRPEVYRYRYPNLRMSLGHTLRTGTQAIFGCHELEVYPSDLLTCASGNALIGLDMRRAFDDNGTPRNFADDRPKGSPLPCRERPSSSLGPFGSGAMVIDCVDGRGEGADDLTVAQWLDRGAPSLEGVRWLGSVHHQGRGASASDPVSTPAPAFDSTEDIDFDHEAELSGSGNLLLATDERGGGVVPPGATCSPVVDNAFGNGGVHFYRWDRLTRRFPENPRQAFRAYARTPDGEKAIFRAPIRTGPQASLCTAHVFQQLPRQNRIFMGWYSQGTRVLDFRERRDGEVRLREAGFFIPTNADEWVSHIFKRRKNEDGSFTYWGAAADFNLGTAGRNAIDIYKVRLPAPPKPARLAPTACRSGGWRLRTDFAGRPFTSPGDCLTFARGGSGSG